MYNKIMKNIINVSELQRNGLKEVYKTINKYGEAFIINQRKNKVLKLVDNDNPYLFINIIKNIKSIKPILNKDYQINRIGIFGSFARGENNTNSDLDIIIDFDFKDFKDLFAIEDLIKTKLKINKIDLTTFKNISPIAFETAKKDIIYV